MLGLFFARMFVNVAFNVALCNDFELFSGKCLVQLSLFKFSRSISCLFPSVCEGAVYLALSGIYRDLLGSIGITGFKGCQTYFGVFTIFGVENLKSEKLGDIFGFLNFQRQIS